MDINVNELPDHKAPAEAAFNQTALVPERMTASTWLKAGGFLAIVFVLTALAINSHQQVPGEAAVPDAPPVAAGSATMPAATAPTERATTGAASTAPARVPAPPQ